jgi:hypothetical protein
VSSAKTIVFGAEMNEQVSGILEDIRKDSLTLYCEGGSSPHAQNMTEELASFSTTAPHRSIRNGLTPMDTWGFIFTRFPLLLPFLLLFPFSLHIFDLHYFFSGTTGFPKAAIMKHFKLLGSPFLEHFPLCLLLHIYSYYSDCLLLFQRIRCDFQGSDLYSASPLSHSGR